LFAHLFSQPVPEVIFPENNIDPTHGNACWGWVKIKENFIFLPRKSFYLPHDELVDLVVHEASHLLTQEKSHVSRVWYLCYRRCRKRIFAQFADFLNAANPQTRFQKGYKIYPSRYEVEYDDNKDL
jgi:predicted metal-dependent hydrolase